jgi:NAD(P)-dependent dehydrogenase (short-subunit alcohol dehydrogenase family)
MRDLMASAPEEVKRSVSLGRLGTPAEVAEAVEFLCGPKAGFINGALISVDGGFMNGV